MVRRGRGPAAGQWSLPGGRVEGGETLAEAVVRELEEEAGIESVCGPLIGWVERFDDDHHFVILDFEVDVLEGAEPVAGDDAAEARWVPLGEISELSVVPGLVEFLHENGILDVIADDADEGGVRLIG
jgi:8-oxo-dGTP diphosphatase